MKKELLIVALGLLGTATFAQNSAKILSGNTKLEQKVTTELNDQSSVKYLNQATQFLNNRTVNTTSKSSAGGLVDIRADYGNTLFDLFGGNVTFDGGFITVFPDTAIMQEGSDGAGGSSFFRPSNHGLVFIYDSQAEVFSNDPNTGVENYFSVIDPVDVDSIFTAGIYFLNNDFATTDRLRFDIVTTNSWGTGAFNTLTATLDVDDDAVDDNVSIQSLSITGNASNGVPAYSVPGATTVFRTFTPADSGAVIDFGVGLTGVQIPANGGMGVLITYEPTTGSYTPNMDTTSLNDGTGNTNIFRSLVLTNGIDGDDNMYWLQFSVAGSQFFNNNSVSGFVGSDERYSTSATNTSNSYLTFAHTTTARVRGVSHVSVTEFNNNKGKFSIYPNPNNGDFNLKLEDFNGDDTYTITVMNILGQTVHEEIVTMGNGVKSFSLSNVDKGLYLINIHSENLNVVEKITIK